MLVAVIYYSEEMLSFINVLQIYSTKLLIEQMSE